MNKMIRDCFATLWSRNDVFTQQGFLKLTKNSLISYLIVATVFFGGGLFYLFNPFIKKTEAVWPPALEGLWPGGFDD